MNDPNIISGIIIAMGTIIATFINLLSKRKRKKKELIKEGIKEEIIVDEKAKKSEEEILGKIDVRKLVGIVLTIACAILFAVSHVLSKFVVDTEINPMVILVGRNIISGLTILIFVLIIKSFYQKSKLRVHLNRDSLYMILGRGFSGIFYLASLIYLSATSMIIIYKLNAIFTFILLLFLIKNKLKFESITNILFGIIVCIIGTFIIAQNNAVISYEYDTEGMTGILLGIGAAFLWSVYIVYAEKHEKTSICNTNIVERQFFLGIIYLISTLPVVLLVVLSVFFDAGVFSSYTVEWKEIGIIAFIGIISGIIGILYFEAIKRISALLVTVIISLEIFFTMIFENIFLENIVTLNIVLGAILVIIGAISVGRESKKMKLY